MATKAKHAAPVFQETHTTAERCSVAVCVVLLLGLGFLFVIGVQWSTDFLVFVIGQP